MCKNMHKHKLTGEDKIRDTYRERKTKVKRNIDKKINLHARTHTRASEQRQ